MAKTLYNYVDTEQKRHSPLHDVIFMDIESGDFYQTNNFSKFAEKLGYQQNHLFNLASGKMRTHKGLIVWKNERPSSQTLVFL